MWMHLPFQLYNNLLHLEPHLFLLGCIVQILLFILHIMAKTPPDHNDQTIQSYLWSKLPLRPHFNVSSQMIMTLVKGHVILSVDSLNKCQMWTYTVHLKQWRH